MEKELQFYFGIKEGNDHRNKTVVIFGDIFILLINLKIVPFQLISLIRKNSFLRGNGLRA